MEWTAVSYEEQSVIHIVLAIYKTYINIRTSAFGTCIEKYVIERYVCLIVFMVIAQTHVQAVATVY